MCACCFFCLHPDWNRCGLFLHYPSLYVRQCSGIASAGPWSFRWFARICSGPLLFCLLFEGLLLLKYVEATFGGAVPVCGERGWVFCYFFPLSGESQASCSEPVVDERCNLYSGGVITGYLRVCCSSSTKESVPLRNWLWFRYRHACTGGGAAMLEEQGRMPPDYFSPSKLENWTLKMNCCFCL